MMVQTFILQLLQLSAICEFSVSALPTFSAQAWRTKQRQ
jgi:hypothetical protein